MNTTNLTSQLTEHASRITEHVSRSTHLRLALCIWVWALALFQFSENTADPDLWGHVAFGQQMLKDHAVERTEIYSWTANGKAFVNHEYGADLIIGGAHLLLGGTGILLLKTAVGLLVFGMVLRLGAASLSWPASSFSWALGALAVVEISFGFAARPQIFTALGLVLELLLLRRIHQGTWRAAFLLPPLFFLWINIHGGALAGVGLLGLAAGATTLQWLWRKDISPRTVACLWLSLLGVVGALFCNPWGADMVRWLIKSVLWFRPEIEEWNPTPLGWDHAAAFILVAVSAFAWAASRNKWRCLWEMAACAAFALLALRSVRNTPLFAIVALALVPPHLADALARFRNYFERLTQVWQHPRISALTTVALLVTALGSLIASFTLHKQNAFTMEIPKSRYPVEAVQFIRSHNLHGKLLVFFDWGDMAILQLPGCPPSIDGRLDAAYSRPLIAAHWNLYNGEPVDESVLPIDQADLALLPSNLAGSLALRNRPGWLPVYFDNTAVVLVNEKTINSAQRLVASSATGQAAIQGLAQASTGRAPFPARRQGRAAFINTAASAR